MDGDDEAARDAFRRRGAPDHERARTPLPRGPAARLAPDGDATV